jgi:hypothetical protein
MGIKAASIAKFLGFHPSDAVIQVLTPGSLFGDFLRESFRHQLENYQILSFWEQKSTVINLTALPRS